MTSSRDCVCAKTENALRANTIMDPVAIEIFFIGNQPPLLIKAKGRVVCETTANWPDPGLSRNTRCRCYRCSVPGLAGFTKRTLCGARDLITKTLMAERVGFEPTERFPVHSISSAASSTTPAPLQVSLSRSFMEINADQIGVHLRKSAAKLAGGEGGIRTHGGR